VSTQSIIVLEALVYVLLVRQKYSAAYLLCCQITGCKQIEHRDNRLFMALRSISEAKSAQQKSGQAGESLKKLVDISAWGRDGSKAIYHMTLLLDCLNITNQSNTVPAVLSEQIPLLCQRLSRSGD
jgi:hypothetical protein